MSNFIIQWWKSRKLRFLVIGAINTAWGFGEFSLLYHLLHARVHALVIQAIATVIGVTFSYVTLKIFVFKTKGNYAHEYISFYGVYAIPITTAFALFLASGDYFGDERLSRAISNIGFQRDYQLRGSFEDFIRGSESGGGDVSFDLT